MKATRAVATHAVFPTTCWTDILSLKNATSEGVREQAMAELCTTYWYPLYAFARHRGKSPHDAEDMVQSFFFNIGSPSYFQKADSDKGKLRTFLLTGFTRHLKDIHVQATALKRGGGKVMMSLDAEQAEEWLSIDPSSMEESPDFYFQRAWAHSTVRTAIDSLRCQASGSEKSETRFEVLCRFLNPDTCLNLTHQQAADELGISIEACDKAIQRLRKNFRETVKELVASTLENPTEENIMEEMRQLQQSLASR